MNNRCKAVKTGDKPFFECTGWQDCEYNPHERMTTCPFRLRGKNVFLCTFKAAQLDALQEGETV